MADAHAFVGDGGATLQRLWDFAEWKMIRNCPGRYILKRRKSAPLLLLLPPSGIPATQVPTRAFVAAALGVAREAVHVHELRSERCADAVCVVVFDAPGGSGGGVITYCKRTPDSVVYVHTLNTASGLRRKLEGLRIAHVLAAPEVTTAGSGGTTRASAGSAASTAAPA